MRIAILAAGLLGAVSFGASAQAQTAPAAEAPAAAAPAAGGFTDAELKSFGAAMTEIQKINSEYSPKLAGADGPTKATVQKEMIGKMGAAVQASGLSPDKYNEMSAAVQKDNALRQRLTQVLNAEPAA
ncbi:DUF4168 domain-containing protein [Phenylobacterium sp.]|uniref:DUF4168 domain-containing protein n=1 Tax=Phenylobacterium sp. TaxID=1871053 RepID=UPI0027307AB9|nr:DUF4168 domain-containing protein [Phenylobacterium sp.]MDP1598610.1 DUF4168 domain-containing protein [Phenylobacterium sp.]MDP3590609.1 DUF4168 domain-containing protein [Phenylobacterium sp.]